MKKFLAILGCLIFMFSGCRDDRVDEYYESGIAAIDQGDYDAAIEDLEQVIQAEERLPEAYRAYGIAWLSKKSYPEAIAAFSRSLNSMDDENEEFEKDVMFYLAEARLLQGEVDKAIEVYGDILKKGEDPQAFFLRGKVYMNRNDYENAGKDFARAVDGCKDYNLYINIYQIYADKNKAVDGDVYLEQALSMEPETGEDFYHRGRIYEYRKDYDKAKEELIQALELEYEDAMLLLGRIYLEMDDSTSARSMYKEYLSQSENGARAYNGLAICDIYEENYDSALENIQKGLAENDSDETRGLLYNEIVAYEGKCDFDTAKEKMKVFLEQYPDDSDALRENEFLSTR
ncbi:MAG: tetratricopeptide repeat protein [Oliverpabstia sp.]